MRNKAWLAAGTIGVLAASAAYGQLGDLAGHAVGAVTGTVSAAAEAETHGQLDSALGNDLQLRGITSELHDGIVTLRGTVESELERDRAERLARSVDGVTLVRNRIAVDGAAAGSANGGAGRDSQGASIGAAIQAGLDADARFEDRDITVKSKDNGVVSLTGEVASEAEKELAGSIAADSEAVTKVRNRLVVRPEAGRDEAE